MGPDEVHVARDGGVLTLTLDRPGDQNRLTRDVIATLQDVADRLAVDPDVQAVVITGSGRIMNMRDLSGFTASRTLSDTLRYALEWSRDVDEGMAAHREGRPPRFTGR